MEIVSAEYQVTYDPEQNLVAMAGKMRLESLDRYQPILDLLTRAIASHPPHFILDVTNLEFLNSSGLSMLLMFVVKVRETGCMGLTIRGSQAFPWQVKSLKNVRRLMPEMQLDLRST